MKNLPFVIWMLGFPTLSNWHDHNLVTSVYPDEGVRVMAIFLTMAFYLFIGYKLYEPNKPQEREEEDKDNEVIL